MTVMMDETYLFYERNNSLPRYLHKLFLSLNIMVSRAFSESRPVFFEHLPRCIKNYVGDQFSVNVNGGKV